MNKVHTIEAGTFGSGELITEQEGWEFSPKKMPWIANILWRLLIKLGAVKPHLGTVATYHFTPEHAMDFKEYVMEALSDVSELMHRPEDYAIIMGRDQFIEIMEDDLGRFMNLNPTYAGKFEWNTPYQSSVFNLPIHVVNTISGFAVVPRLVAERRVG